MVALHHRCIPVQTSTTEGWLVVAHLGMDARGVDKQPHRNAQGQAAIFFVVFILLTTFFLNGLFIGVVYGKPQIR